METTTTTIGISIQQITDMFSAGLITYIADLSLISVTIAIISCFFTQMVNDAYTNVWMKGRKIDSRWSWIANIVFNAIFTIMFVYTFDGKNTAWQTWSYIFQIFAFSFCISVLFYLFIMKLVLTGKDIVLNMLVTKKVESEMEIQHASQMLLDAKELSRQKVKSDMLNNIVNEITPDNVNIEGEKQ